MPNLLCAAYTIKIITLRSSTSVIIVARDAVVDDVFCVFSFNYLYRRSLSLS